MMRLGHFRPVHVKSAAAQHMRATLVARKQLVNQVVMIECTIRGILKVQGLKVGAVHRCTFAKRVEELLEGAPETRLAIEPLLVVRNLMREENRLLGYRLERLAKKDDVCRLLMTIPGVGPLTSLAYKATIDDPTRFSNSKAVSAHLGLTPRVYQSGEIDHSGRISKCGDKLLRYFMYEAAMAHLTRNKYSTPLKVWGVQLARKVGTKRACVAVARKLAIIMHQMWLTGEAYRFSREDAAIEAA